MARFRLLVVMNAKKGEEKKWQDFYVNQDIKKEILSVPGFVGVQRFKVRRPTGGAGWESPGWEFIGMYDMEADDPSSALAVLDAAIAAGTINISDALDTSTVHRIVLETLTDRFTA